MTFKTVIKKGALFAALYSLAGAAVIYGFSLLSEDAGVTALFSVAGIYPAAALVAFYRLAESADGVWWKAALWGLALGLSAGAAGALLLWLGLLIRVSAGYPYGLDMSKDHTLIVWGLSMVFLLVSPAAGLFSGWLKSRARPISRPEGKK